MSKTGRRAGTYALSMAGDPVNRRLLRDLANRPFPAGRGGEYQITSGGREGLFLGFVIERWLQQAPAGPISAEDDEAERATTALAGGWTSTLVHTLAREPMTLPELQSEIGGMRRRELKRRLDEMLATGLVATHTRGEEDAIYAVTDWLRAGIATLITGARVERRSPNQDMAPIDALDVEAAFLLALPLLELPQELSGVCSLGVNLADDETFPLTGVTAQIAAGRIASCSSGLSREVDAWAAATASAWLDTVIEPDAKRVRTGGDRWLAAALLDRLHQSLFGVQVG